LRDNASIPRDYEMMVVISPSVGDEGLQGAIDRVSGYLTTLGATVDNVNHENPWGRRRLAYQIQDFRDAFYVLYRFHAGAPSIIDLERELRLDEQVIRHLVVRYDELAEHEERAPRVQAPGGPRFGQSAEGQTAPPPASSERVEPVQTDAAAVEATDEVSTAASTETADSGEPPAGEEQ
jgi:small subunit ribosomal protein S6